ncbi:hypothetical protein VTJ83DRAFT_3925 [Remersonia thermophila]|uniref:Uncharacterized protein n=1 Tax=Remersonia thermophila TaxID=72144 RepID=A0ABR4DFK7_9PEZI
MSTLTGSLAFLEETKHACEGKQCLSGLDPTSPMRYAIGGLPDSKKKVGTTLKHTGSTSWKRSYTIHLGYQGLLELGKEGDLIHRIDAPRTHEHVHARTPFGIGIAYHMAHVNRIFFNCSAFFTGFGMASHLDARLHTFLCRRHSFFTHSFCHQTRCFLCRCTSPSSRGGGSILLFFFSSPSSVDLMIFQHSLIQACLWQSRDGSGRPTYLSPAPSARPLLGVLFSWVPSTGDPWPGPFFFLWPGMSFLRCGCCGRGFFFIKTGSRIGSGYDTSGTLELFGVGGDMSAAGSCFVFVLGRRKGSRSCLVLLGFYFLVLTRAHLFPACGQYLVTFYISLAWSLAMLF